MAYHWSDGGCAVGAVGMARYERILEVEVPNHTLVGLDIVGRVVLRLGMGARQYNRVQLDRRMVVPGGLEKLVGAEDVIVACMGCVAALEL